MRVARSVATAMITRTARTMNVLEATATNVVASTRGPWPAFRSSESVAKEAKTPAKASSAATSKAKLTNRTPQATAAPARPTPVDPTPRRVAIVLTLYPVS